MKRNSVSTAPSVLSSVAMSRVIAYLNLLMAVDRNPKGVRKPKASTAVAKKAVDRGPRHSGPCFYQQLVYLLVISFITKLRNSPLGSYDRHHCYYA
ncbi:MAG TPA: hypothetical protein VJJ81_01925 [Candidatus Babeliales bacterium]|nr:hypothetical protein [Candidatus Babeliales bacterium]